MEIYHVHPYTWILSRSVYHEELELTSYVSYIKSIHVTREREKSRAHYNWDDGTIRAEKVE